MVLKLYGNTYSTCAIRVKTILLEKQVPFEFINVNMIKGEHKSPEFLEKQPFGMVPYIDDDGFILYESRAICLYIAHKYRDQGTPLLPDPNDLQAQALLWQAMSAELTNFAWADRALVEGLFKVLFKGQPANTEGFNHHIESLQIALDGFERILSKQKYMAGDNLTVVDFFYLPFAEILKPAGSDIMESPTRPNVLRWYTEMRNRESYRNPDIRAGLKIFGITD